MTGPARKMSKRNFSAAVAGVLIFLLACACADHKNFSKNPPTSSLTAQWDQAFARSSGWTGGDVAASFVIPGKRVLWVFGDSFIGDVENGKHVRSTLVNNAIAVHPFDPDRPGKAPAPETINFFWGPNDESGKPTAWVRPAQKGNSKTWYWPTGGGVVFSTANGSKKLALFLILLEKNQGEDSLWAFKVIGSDLAIIDDVDEPAEPWKTRVMDLPDQAEPCAGGQVEWGMAAIAAPGYVYVYGTVADPSNNRDLLLARAPASGFEDFSTWEFFSKDQKWDKSICKAFHIVKGVASELSVDKVSGKNSAQKYMMVYSEPMFGERIFVRTAGSPEGPWSDAQPVFTVPELKRSKNYFAYAAKGHAALSPPHSLLVSYIVNSHDFTELINNASIYRPQFIVLGSGLDM